MNLAGRLVIGAIRTYQWTASTILPTSCRYLPTCSSYACEAVTRHGLPRGGWLAVRRILRCHPWGGSGYDPVPDAAGKAAAGQSCRHGGHGASPEPL